MHNFKLSNRELVTFSVIIIIIGIIIISSDYINEKRNKAFEQMDFNIFDKVSDKSSESKLTKDVGISKNVLIQYNYVGILEIPSINLKRGFLNKKSPYNRVSRNIQIMSESTYPDEKKGNVILAAHSGNTSVSFFRNLYKLKVGNIAYITYNNTKYTYIIKKIYTQPKTGIIAIYRNRDTSTLTLITCTKSDESTQTVYIAYKEGE